MSTLSSHVHCIQHQAIRDASSDPIDPRASVGEAASPPVSSEMSSADASGLCHDPPAVSLPEIPPGFVPCPPADLRGHRPMKSERAAAREAMVELPQLGDWESLFGVTAPAPSELVDRLTLALRWSELRTQVMAFARYVQSYEGVAWKQALETVEAMKTPFELVARARPARLQAYPGLARLLGAQKTVSRRAAADRARRRRGPDPQPPAESEPVKEVAR